MNKKAFTLIELLVVIAIIAILAAILFPVFAQAKAAAKKISTVSNSKQVGLGVLMYLGDSDDNYPMGCSQSWWYPADGGWTLVTQPYIKNLPILRDPSDQLSEATWPDWAKGPNSGVLPISIVANGMLKYENNCWNVNGVMGQVQGWETGHVITNSGSINQPANSIMLSERYGSQNIFGPGSFIMGVNFNDNSGWPGEIPDGTRDGTPYTYVVPKLGTFTANQNNRMGAVTAIYGSGLAAMTYTDGHAKAVNPITTDPDPVNQPQNNQWDVYR